MNRQHRIRCTIGDVLKAFEVQRSDPGKFARSPRLQWLVATFWELVDQSERERAQAQSRSFETRTRLN
jgi:hypothetical protein